MTREEKIKALDDYCNRLGEGMMACKKCKLEKPCDCDHKNFHDLTDEQLDNALALIVTREDKIAELCKSNAYSWSFFKDMPDSRVDAYYNFHRKVQGFVPTMSNPVTIEFEKENNVHESEQDGAERTKYCKPTNIKLVDAMIETQGIDAVINHCVCEAFELLWGHNYRNPVDNIRSASTYLNKAVELMNRVEEDCQ